MEEGGWGGGGERAFDSASGRGTHTGFKFHSHTHKTVGFPKWMNK